MNRTRRILGTLILPCGLLLSLAGCTYYQTAPGVYAPVPNAFDRSWSAAVGALRDEGVRIVEEDRAAGHARGTLGTTMVTAEVRSQSDGGIRVEFKTSGADAPAGLIDRITQGYNRRMGR